MFDIVTIVETEEYQPPHYAFIEDDEILVIGGNRGSYTYYVRDSGGTVQVTKEFIDSNPRWYTRAGCIEFGDEVATFYIFDADPPL